MQASLKVSKVRKFTFLKLRFVFKMHTLEIFFGLRIPKNKCPLFPLNIIEALPEAHRRMVVRTTKRNGKIFMAEVEAQSGSCWSEDVLSDMERQIPLFIVRGVVGIGPCWAVAILGSPIPFIPNVLQVLAPVSLVKAMMCRKAGDDSSIMIVIVGNIETCIYLIMAWELICQLTQLPNGTGRPHAGEFLSGNSRRGKKESVLCCILDVCSAQVERIYLWWKNFSLLCAEFAVSLST